MNNRSSINDGDIVNSEQILDKGFPLPLLSGKYEVKEGYKAIILVGGVFEEILSPGFYYLSRYSMFRNVRSILVDMRVKQLHVKTSREFQIKYPASVQVDLDLTAEYKVVDPRIVAIEYESPLQSFYDRIIAAASPVISTSSIEEVRTGGEEIGQKIFQRLKADHLEKLIGIEVFNIVVTTIKALDAGEDILAQDQTERYFGYQDLQFREMLRRKVPDFLDRLEIEGNKDDLIKAYLDDKTRIYLKLLEEGGIDPASFLNQAAGNPGVDSNQLSQSLSPFLPQSNRDQGGQPKLSESTMTQPQDIHSRIKEEVEFLKKLPGAAIEVKLGRDEDGIADGSYNLRVEVPSTSGEKLTCYIHCNTNYPNEVPIIETEVNGEEIPFESSILRHWNKQYLIEIIREVLSYRG